MLIFLQFSIGIGAVVTSSRHRPFCFHNFVFLLSYLFVLYRNVQRATRISVCVIAVSKSHEFCWKFLDFLHFFRRRRHTPSCRRVVIFSTTMQGIRLRRRVNVFHDVGHYWLRALRCTLADVCIRILNSFQFLVSIHLKFFLHVGRTVLKLFRHFVFTSYNVGLYRPSLRELNNLSWFRPMLHKWTKRLSRL